MINYKYFCGFVLFVFSCFHLSAQDRLTPELLWELDRIGQEDLSGHQLIYGLSDYDLAENKGNRDLYLFNLKTTQTTKLTSKEGSEYNAQFRPGTDRIAYLSGGQLFEINADGSGEKLISEGPFTSFKFSGDGNKIVYTQEVEYEVFENPYPDLPKATARVYNDLMFRHWDHWEDQNKSNLFVADLTDNGIENAKNIVNEAFDVPLSPFGGKEEYNVSNDGQWVAYTCKKTDGKDYAVSTNSDIYLYHTTTGETKNMTAGMMGYDKEPSFSPDGRYIIWSSMEREGYEADRNRLFIQDLANGKREEISDSWDFNANHPTFDPSGDHIYFLSGQKATIQILKYSLKSKELETLTKGRHNYYDFLINENHLIGRKCSMISPHELYRVDKENGRDERITFVTQDVMSKVKSSRIKERWIKTHDNKDMLVWYIYPPDFDPNKKYPALLYCQGGPQAAVNQFFSYRWNFQLMAANDYIIVAPNRRGLPSFGTEWNEVISKDWGGGAMKDYLSAIDDAVEFEKAIDADRLGAIGASFGGYSVYWLAGNHENRFKTFISHCGLFNLESWYGTTEEMFFANWDIGGPYWESEWKENYKKDSPHKYVGNWDTPILVIHGEKDFRVPISEGLQAFQVAQLKGIPSKFLYFPDEGHWVLGPQNGVFWHRSFFSWLDKYLKPDSIN